MQKGLSSTMTTPTFAATLKSVEHKTPERQVLTMLNRHGDRAYELRQFLMTDQSVPAPVRAVASSTPRWNKLHAKSIDWRSPDSLPARALELSRAIVFRVFRTPKGVADDKVFMRLRMLTALVGLHQLRALRMTPPVSRPYTHLRNFAVTMNLAPEGKSVKNRLDSATALGLLYPERPSAKAKPGVWVVKGLSKREKLNAAEEAIAVAIASGDESNFAAALLLHADHLAFHYEPDGLRAWWLLLRVAADPFTELMSAEEERLVYQVPSLDALDGLVSGEARAEHAARVAVREEGKMTRARETKLTSLVYSHLAFDSLSEHSIREWTEHALAALLAIPPERRYIATELVAHLKKMLPQRLTEPRQIGGVLAYLEGNLIP